MFSVAERQTYKNLYFGKIVPALQGAAIDLIEELLKIEFNSSKAEEQLKRFFAKGEWLVLEEN